MITTLNIDPGVKYKEISDIVDLPKLIYVSEINEKSARRFRKQVFDAIREENKAIVIEIDSYGGDVSSVLSMIDTLKYFEGIICTHATGKAMSAAVFLLASGTKNYRFADKSTSFMLHEVSSATSGKSSELSASSSDVKKLNNLLFNHLDTVANKEAGFFTTLLKENNNADLYFSPQTAKKYGLISSIGCPSLILSLKYTVDIV